MTFADSAIWFIWSIGFGMGFAYRVWGEPRFQAPDTATWQHKIGCMLVKDFDRVDLGHRYAGDEMTVDVRAKYYVGSRYYWVHVSRASSIDGDV